MLEITYLQNAVDALENAFQLYDARANRGMDAEVELLRDGVIQRFEIAFELSWKTLRRYLSETGLESLATATNRDLFRLAFERELVRDASQWLHYLLMRNQTTHIYDNAKAQQVFDAAREFLPDARGLINAMRAKPE